MRLKRRIAKLEAAERGRARDAYGYPSDLPHACLNPCTQKGFEYSSMQFGGSSQYLCCLPVYFATI